MNNAPYALGDYKVGKRIASGGFGFVYRGKAPDGKKVAIKYERTYNRITRPYLQHEADVYRLLEGDPCVPKVYAYGREIRWNIMVFDMLGTSLETLLEKCNGKFSLKTMLMLAPQIIECIEYVHSKGIIHRDIKPDNFLMGIGDRANLVHIIDFGLARRFRHPRTLEHFPYFEGHNFFGTTRFASLKALEGCSQSRRDDLESAAYSLVYFVRGRLPWQGLRGGTEKHRDQRVREKKRTWTPERLCEGLPGAEELIKMLHYVKSLDYTDEPDYEYLKDLFRDRLKKEGYELDYDYDWLHVVESENESGDGLSITGSRKGSKVRESSDHRISVDSGSADDEAEVVTRKVPRSPATGSKHASGSLLGECASLKTDSQISPLTASKQSMKKRIFSASPRQSGSRSTAPSAKPSDVSGSHSRSSSNSEPNSIRRSRSLDSPSSSLSSDSSTLEELPIRKGDFVLIKFLARPTLEKGSLKTDSSAAVDDSYWHQPSLSEDEWLFPFRPAIVTKVDVWDTYTRLFVLPIMQRNDGLERISPTRRQVFFQICTDKEAGAVAEKKKDNSEDSSEKDDESPLKLQPTPAWPLDGTYVHHQYDILRIHVPTDAVKDIKVVWRLEKPQLKEHLRAHDDCTRILNDDMNDDNSVSDGGSETEEVKRRFRRRRAVLHYPLFGEIASLDEEALKRPDVELKGSNGWLPEFYKTDRRRNHENGYYTGDSDYDSDDENTSMYTGAAPGNRRLSCTLAIDGDVIVEAASQAGSDRDSRESSRYRTSRSPRSRSPSEAGSFRSRGSPPRSSKAGGARDALSLRHAILDSVVRSGYKSPAVSRQGSADDSGSSDHSAVSSPVYSASARASSSTLSSHASFQLDRGSAVASVGTSSNVGTSSVISAASTESNVGSSIGCPRRVCTSDNCSCAGSDAGSVDSAAVARKIAKQLKASPIEGLNEKATAVKRKVMVDKAIQTDVNGELAPPTSTGSQASKSIEARA